MSGVYGFCTMGMAVLLMMLAASAQAQTDDQICCENKCLSDYFKESGGCNSEPGGDAFVTAKCITSSSEASDGCVDACPADPACATQCFADYLSWSRRCSGNSVEMADCITSAAGDAEYCVKNTCRSTASACAARCLADYFASSGGCPGGASDVGTCIASYSRTARDCVGVCSTASACAQT